MKTERYEHRTNGHYKFWTVRPPQEVKGSWGVLVTYGKIGTAGKDNWHFTWSKASADHYYYSKIQEKLKKGYKFVTPEQPKPKSPIFVAKPDYYPVQAESKKEKQCEHNQLRKTSPLKWKCNACGTQIEFDRPQQAVALTVVEEAEQVRRFFDFSALQR